jgi:cytochrome c oxidase assembly protein subunit 11
MTDDGRRTQMNDRARQTTGDGPRAGSGSADASSAVARRRFSDLAVAAACGVFVAMMVGVSFAAVPLYSWFCRTTGFAGTPLVAHVAPGQISDRQVTVRFDANIGAGLPWRFEPERTSIDVRLGEVVTIDSEQRLAPGEKREMAVVFYVDPALARDSDQDDLNTITLSYTFYPVREPKAGVADSAPTGAGKKI